MGTVTGKVPLAPFAHNWVGGDIGGLAQLAGTLFGYAPQVTDVASALNAQVRQVVDAAGWQGHAASAFTAAWQRDSVTAQAVGLAADQVAGIVGWLAVRLSQIEAGLEQAAAEVAAHGVPVGADGEPPQVCYAGTGAAQATAQQWLSDYQMFYAQCQQSARAAREEAAGWLAATVRQIMGNANPSPVGVAGQVGTAADLVGDLLAQPSATLRDKARQLAEISEEVSKFDPKEHSVDDLLDFIDDTESKLDSIDTDVRVAEAEERALTRLADYRVGDALDKMMKAPRGDGADVKGGEPDAGGDGEAGIVDDLRDIPVLDVLAAVLGTGLGSYQDTHGPHPESLEVALPEEAGANFGGLGAAAVVGEAAGEAGGPVGFLAGVVIPDAIDNQLHEPFGADIHQDGLVKGDLAGQIHVAKNTIGDVVDQVEQSSALSEKLDTTLVHVDTDEAKTVGKAAEQAWDDIPFP